MSDPTSPDQRESSPRSSMSSRVNLLIGRRRRSVVALAGCSIIAGFTEAGLLALIAQVAATLVTGAKQAHIHIGPIHLDAAIGTLLGIAFALAIARTALQVPLSILPARIAADVQSGIRTKLFDAFTRASWTVQSRDREGLLQETMTGQVMQATGGALQTTTLVISLFTFLVLIASALALNAVAAVIVASTSVLLFGLLRPLRSRGIRSARALSKAQLGYAGGIAESIRVAEETQVFGVAAAQRSQIDAFVQSSRDLYFRTQLISRLAMNLYQSMIYILLVSGIAGLYFLAHGRHAGSLGAIVLLLVRAGTTGQTAQGAYQALSQSLPFIERTQDAVQRYLESSPIDGGQPLPRVRTLAFENVSFAYDPGRPVLSDISFEIAGSEVVGIIGPSGAGKSTLVQLLLQLRRPEGGRYLVNGMPADAYARDDWHRQVSYVPQEPRLLHASVAENIRFFREIDDEAVERAGRLARIHDDVMGWANGYETVVGPRANAVSGGQQQRICLARALAARPEVLVLDEPTSALDPHSEALIGESLTALKDELTLFIIAHRMSTLEMCDRVMVIVGGRLVAFDTKALLQTQNDYYRHASQLAAGTSGPWRS
jgi:ATP-binding cassette, subfamily B, bacterial